MSTYQAVLVIVSSNLVPVICGGAITYLWMKWKGYKKVISE